MIRVVGETWGTLSKGGASLVAVIAVFLLPPPKNLAASGSGGVQPAPYAAFLVAVLLGFLMLLMNRWKLPTHAIRWACVSAGLLVLSVAIVFAYSGALVSVATTYDGEQVIVGSVYTTNGLNYMRKHPSASREQVVEDADGGVEDVWTSESIAANSRLVLALYLGVFLSAATAVVSLLQAIHCEFGAQGSEGRDVAVRRQRQTE